MFSVGNLAAKRRLMKEDEATRNTLAAEINSTLTKVNVARIRTLEEDLSTCRQQLSVLELTTGDVEVVTTISLLGETEQRKVDRNETRRKELRRCIEDIEHRICQEKDKGTKCGTAATTQQLAAWDPYDQNKSSGFFDSEWMFGIKDGFDIVIANPPYIPIESMTENDKIAYQTLHPELSRKYDSSIVFILTGLSHLSAAGVLCYISSVTWQTGENFTEVRKRITQDGGLHLLVNLPWDMFEEAYVDTGIYLLSRERSPHYLLYCFPKSCPEFSMQDLPLEKIGIDLIESPDFKVVLNPNAAKMLDRIRKVVPYEALGDISVSTQGLAGSRFPRAARKATGDVFPFVEKGQVYRYVLSVSSTYNVDMSGTQSLMAHYEAVPKLLIRRVVNRQKRLMATFCDKRLVFKKDVNPFRVTNSRFPPKYVLGILNSRLMSFLYVNTSSIATKDDFGQTTLAELRRLPIAAATPDQQKRIERLVRRILSAKERDVETNTDTLERQIDELVYTIYGLTEKEIAIVEGRR